MQEYIFNTIYTIQYLLFIEIKVSVLNKVDSGLLPKNRKQTLLVV